MYLKSLEINGFKSFAKKAVLHFNSAVTGIVGPNGSGKSNVAEAFRFVLGEQSIKSMRGKRGEDLIWNGGGEAAGPGRSNRASVKVVFDNTSRIFSTVDFDEIVLERVVNRDNSNEYLLNGSQVRLKDIIELLAGAHIGAAGHHIISQGEADRILSASIGERRDMIEEALGLRIYQWKKIESLRKLERTEENMKQVESLRREIAPHLKFLKKQVEKVEKGRQIRLDLIEFYLEYFAYEEWHNGRERSRLESETAGPKKELEQSEKALLEAKKVLTEARSIDRQSEKLIHLDARLKTAREARAALVRESGRLEGELSANEKVIEKEEERMRQEEFQTVYLKDVQSLIGRIESLNSISDAKDLLVKVVAVIRDFIAGHRSSADSSLIGEAKKDIARIEAERSNNEEKMKAGLLLENSLVAEYEDLKHAIERDKDTDRETEKEIFRIIARQNELRHVLGELENALGNVREREEDFKKELGQAGLILGREATAYQRYMNRDWSGENLEKQKERRQAIERQKIRLEDAGLGGGSEVLKEFKETEERDGFLAREVDDLEKAKAELLKLIEELDARIDFEFKSGILKINDQFQKYFTLMFGGGKAELCVVKEVKRRPRSDIEDLGDALESAPPEEESGPAGLEVSVSLPRKKVKNLMMLSGGERALTSIALLFAVSQVNPPPFIILDETDAALDEANSKKYGDMIENLAKQSQLILITHNRETMSRSGIIYGVTMGAEGSSRLLSIAFDEALTVAK